MLVFPNAKINLGLNVISKRDDGFHNIQSVFYPIPYCDALEVVKAEKSVFRYEGLSIQGNTNLVEQAYELLKKDYDLAPIESILLKGIPIGAGLGGGSSDGAFMLKVLNRLFELELSFDQLIAYAIQLGSDCAFFIKNEPSIISGRGEEIKSIDVSLNNQRLIVATPDISINTGEAYTVITPQMHDDSPGSVLRNNIESWSGKLINDFESYVFSKYPQINLIKDLMIDAGANYASLTGTGASVYGFFNRDVDLHFPENVKVWVSSI